jgi:hypothetical protein
MPATNPSYSPILATYLYSSSSLSDAANAATTIINPIFNAIF